ncbi:hypothetical protein K504DRAFT_42505 [Pleomassaria siparia CBS 279.74]|uniref:C2H2-type domain-containing protein n=1 Tax=Pleomassaria siparia CBS 279.74 TaxID=1314801 RepID=A0A6G1K5L2_9PLEO|nr:hypothetical protein K504DRAFT_42505 [Pleomassaria siparia CBS 279.74]
MTINQYNPLPQISCSDPSTFAAWQYEQNKQMNFYQHTGLQSGIMHAEDMEYNDFDDFDDNGAIDEHGMQRFMYEAFPISHNVLHAKFDRGTPLQAQHLKQYEQPWPSLDFCAYSPRNASPDGTSISGTSSQALQSELQSPHSFQTVLYETPNDFQQSPLPYSCADYFDEGGYPIEPPLTDGSICLQEIEFQHPEHETIAEEQEDEHDHEHEHEHEHEHGHNRNRNQVNMKPEHEYDAELDYPKMELTPDSYQSYPPDSGISNSIRDAESVQPMPSMGDEEVSDSDYKPSPKVNRRRSSAASNGSTRQTQRRRPRKSAAVSTHSTPRRITKRTRNPNTSPTTSKASNSAEIDARPFPCPFAGYGCQSNFVSKNEWKRHVSTQHIKLGFWRCDLCTTSVDPHDDNTVYHNDFNRKDLFTQHLRRMHAAASNPSTVRVQRNNAQVVTEDNISEHQQRCYQTLRRTPPQSNCLYCERIFKGPDSWEERMEHVGRHLEQERKENRAITGPEGWKRDDLLERWLVDEDLVAMERGMWKIGDGKNRRSGQSKQELLTVED